MKRGLVALILITLAAPSLALAKKMTLPELITLAHGGNAGLQAGAAATAAMEAQVLEAQLNWLPTGDLLSILGPSPVLHCEPNPEVCMKTQATEASLSTLSWRQVFTRTEVRLIQPVFDFGKIAAGVRAAREGVVLSQQREAGARADVDLNVTKAYYGLKLARELLAALDDGVGYIDSAQKRIESDLAKGTGSATVTDKLRLRTVRAEIDARVNETKRMEALAREGLRALIGTDAPADLDIDDEPLEAVVVPEHPLSYYEEQARYSRPEVQLLDHAVRAKKALADLERRREYPDLVLVFSGTFAFAGGVDNPQNAFLNHYFNSSSAGVAAALRMQLDIGPKIARAQRSAAEASEIELRRNEGMAGVLLDVRKAYGELTEAQARSEAVHKGERAGKSWISAVAQNFAVGLAEARDLSDALTAFFQMRARYLQSVFDVNVAAAALARATGTTTTSL
jgi:outer membrane protein TolC